MLGLDGADQRRQGLFDRHARGQRLEVVLEQLLVVVGPEPQDDGVDRRILDVHLGSDLDEHRGARAVVEPDDDGDPLVGQDEQVHQIGEGLLVVLAADHLERGPADDLVGPVAQQLLAARADVGDREIAIDGGPHVDRLLDDVPEEVGMFGRVHHGPSWQARGPYGDYTPCCWRMMLRAPPARNHAMCSAFIVCEQVKGTTVPSALWISHCTG